ncbi:Ig-like domain-containing protein [Simiduia sp. 21SJ11W-1]|uniref:Ig-like domain-containing protein n=1 Tax=Simiduia sp. 21SJ11W-1 TaxID=2909669 RepID=UPI0020A2218C|nr:Ig-like domain-containing protein [Simiduia sp. 21SJ11W-1]UTA48356.1 Ig-like domain-containing protein [Simiduia sp. 21SJ11W-1]
MSYQWSNRYSYTTNEYFADYWGTPVATYGSRGTESTYTYDLAADKNYVIQAMADNGPVESWDGGATWSNVWMRQNGFLSDVQAVEIATANGKKMVLAQMAPGFGGLAGTGNLYIKHLDDYSPNDQWEFYAGGANWRGALPDGLFSDIAESPAAPGRIFVFSRGHGLYLQQNLNWGYNEHMKGKDPWFKKISNGVAGGINSVKKISPHPTNADIVYLSATSGDQGVFKGEYNGADWVWEKLYEGGGWDAEVQAWDNAGQLILFYSGKSVDDGEGDNFVGVISLDGGTSWKTVLKSTDSRSVVSHDWFDVVTSGPAAYQYQFQSKGGLLGYEDKVFMAHYDHTLQKHYAILEGTVTGSSTANAAVTWQDISGDLHFGGLTSSHLVSNDSGALSHYVSTAGAGAWFRSMPGEAVVPVSGVSIGACPTDAMNIDDQVRLLGSVLPANATDKGIVWKSTDSGIASVSSSGWVKAVAAGSAVISATSADGLRTSSCEVSVLAAADGQGYRYLTLRAHGTVELPSTIQQIHFMQQGESYPSPKLTSGTKHSASSSTDGSSDYRAFDNSNSGWVIGDNFPAWITIDLGQDTAITPDAIMIKASANNRALSGFDILGSDNGSDWTLIHSRSGLSTSDYSGLTTLHFNQ